MRPRGPRAGRQRGQSTVEFALVLPLVVLVLLVVVQVGLVVRDQVLVVHAAREAARSASVGGTDDQVRRAAIGAGPLSASRLSVTIDRADGSTDGSTDGSGGGTVRVTVRYRSQTDLPLAGALVPDLDLTADAVMAREQ